MSDPSPAPFIDLPLRPKGESLPRRVIRYIRRNRARVTAVLALAAGGIAVGGHFLGGIAGIWEFYRFVTGHSEAATPAKTAAPFMSLAVLPFSPASNSEEHQRAADRLTRDVISAVERAIRFALVVSHGRAAKANQNSPDPRAVGGDLNVRYLLEGDVRSENGGTIVTARLLDAANGRQLWSDRLAAPSGGADDGNSAVVAQLANRVRPVLYDVEQKRVVQQKAGAASAQELVLRADASWDQDLTLKGALDARKLYEEALARDPASVSALLGLLHSISMEMYEDPAHDHDRILKQLDDLSLRAVRADKDDTRAWIVRSRAMAVAWKWDGALEANAQALRIDPYRNSTLGDRGGLFILMGRPEESFPVLDRAIALDPRGPGVPGYLHFVCWAHLQLGQYDDAITACEKGRALDNGWIFLVRLIAAYTQKGETDKASMLKTELMNLRPKLTIAQLASWKASDNPTFIQQREANLFNPLRKAGVPER